MIKKLLMMCTLCISVYSVSNVFSQTKPLSQQMAAKAMSIWEGSPTVGSTGSNPNWNYTESVVLRGFEELYKSTGDKKYFDYIKSRVDLYVQPDGTIRSYKGEEYSIDNIPMGRLVLMMYKATNEEKYRKAAALVDKQLVGMPRTKEGGLWHKAIYPWQMWLDGLYMGQPFNAEYTKLFNQDAKRYDDLTNQFMWMENHTRDDKTGLLYHGWDESKGMKWANDQTGRSPHFWSRAIGWYAMALVDVRDFMPANHPGHQKLNEILLRTAEGIKKYQDPQSGVWWQITDSINAKGNYKESSASSMFVYALAKGVRMGYLPASYLDVAKKGFEGIKKEFVEQDGPDMINFKNTCRGAGLGNNPYRDGSYRYYLSKPIITNNAHGVGAFLLAASEIERTGTKGEKKIKK